MMFMRPYFRYIVLSFVLASCVADSSTSTSKPALPRSVTFRTYSDGESPLLWNPSSQIDREGFLARPYVRIPSELEVGKDAIGGKHRKSILADVPVRIRQVPGDGNCLFHSLTICLSKVENGTHFCYDNNLEAEKALCQQPCTLADGSIVGVCRMDAKLNQILDFDASPSRLERHVEAAPHSISKNGLEENDIILTEEAGCRGGKTSACEKILAFIFGWDDEK